ncbi:MAG: hypothetical protein RLZZ29_142 [Cyanobacteriota bacterium]
MKCINVRSVDVKDIHLDECITRLELVLKLHQDIIPSYHVMIFLELKKWILMNNFFEFQSKVYQQIVGIAMGNTIAPTMADLFLLSYELQWQHSTKWPWNCFYRRYLDDIILISPAPKKAILSFTEMLNSTSKGLKFTFEINENKATFLDLVLVKGSRFKKKFVLDIELYIKPTNCGLFTFADSYVPNAHKFSFINGEVVRILRNSSSEGAYLKRLDEFCHNLSRRGYTEEILKRYIRYSYSDRSYMLGQKPDSRNVLLPLEIMKIPNKPHREIITDCVKKSLSYLHEQGLVIDIRLCITQGKNVIQIANSACSKVLRQSTHATKIQ